MFASAGRALLAIDLDGRYGRQAVQPVVAGSGMSAFEPETVEICRSLGMVPADLFRPVSLFEI
jgi:hypothetical protein